MLTVELGYLRRVSVDKSIITKIKKMSSNLYQKWVNNKTEEWGNKVVSSGKM